MRLKSIKLAGFKSFVDPTSIPFPRPLSAIVGPNGCGKSNVIDAVRWVMGESSAKQLRGAAATDVIFAGSNGRAPVGQASVELLFDNTDGKLGGEYAGYSELSVKRKVTRDGQSHYFLNGSRCRRKDIADVFLGTGLGPRSYSIIEQGMISRLIEAKPEELRVYLEEAAGISKYKERRRETENRIRHTRENLERLDDIREELERQLRTLKRQSEAAEKYRAWKAEERGLKGKVAALRWNTLEQQLESLGAQLREKEVAREEAQARRAELERDLEHYRERHGEASEAANRLQGEFFESASAISGKEQEIRHAQQRIEQLRQDLEQTLANRREAEAHLQVDTEQQAALDRELAELAPELERSSGRRADSEAALEQAEQDMHAWQAEWDAFVERAEEPRRQAEVEQSRIRHHERSLDQLRDRIARLEGEKQGIDTQAAVQELAGLQARVRELEQETADKIRRGQEAVQQIATNRERMREADAALEQERNSLSSLKGRLASLEELQAQALGRRSEALGEWLQERGLQDAARLGERIQAEPRWATAVETVLGGWLQAVCTDGVAEDLATAAQAADLEVLLVQQSPPTTTVQPGTLAACLSGSWNPGGLLNGVRTAEDTRAALAMREQLRPGESVVTPAGLWLGRDWLRAPGSGDAESGVLARQQELETLRGDIAAGEQRLAAARTTCEELLAALKELEAERDRWQNETNQLNRSLADVRSRASAVQARKEQTDKRLARILADLEECHAQQDEEQAALQTARRGWDAALESIESDRGEQETLAARRDAFRAALESARQVARADGDAAHQLQIRSQSLRTRQESLQKATERLTGQIGQLGEREGMLQQQLEAVRAPIPDLQQALQTLLDQKVEIEGRLSAARDRVAEVEKTIREREQHRGGIESEVSGIAEALENLRIQKRGLEVQQENLLEQVADMQQDLAELQQGLDGADTIEQCTQELESVQRRIERLGPINLAAIEEFQSQSERKGYLDAQHADLTEALETLERAIRKIDRETRELFRETFEKVNTELKDLFPRVFGGGQAFLEMTGEDLLDTGVQVRAQTPGKKNQHLSQLSGGEKALTAIALVFSIFNLNPAPFCMLDEVDAPLDDANVGRFAALVEAMSEKVQFIVITHNKITMEVAQQLMGVTMHEPGVSRIVSVDVEEMI